MKQTINYALSDPKYFYTNTLNSFKNYLSVITAAYDVRQFTSVSYLIYLNQT